MSADARLAEIITELERVGVTCLVMGGHAVRYYGLERNTIDFDLHLAPECWVDLPQRLSRAALSARGPLTEGSSWRPHAFRRFQIGQLPDGREEWLEFWRHNHLLAPYAELFARREEACDQCSHRACDSEPPAQRGARLSASSRISGGGAASVQARLSGGGQGR